MSSSIKKDMQDVRSTTLKMMMMMMIKASLCNEEEKR
jgi:hypothetical protein